MLGSGSHKRSKPHIRLPEGTDLLHNEKEALWERPHSSAEVQSQLPVRVALGRQSSPLPNSGTRYGVRGGLGWLLHVAPTGGGRLGSGCSRESACIGDT